MRIGIDATGIGNGLQTGITAYTIHLINNLIKKDNKNKYYIYCPKEISPHLSTIGPSVKFRVLSSNNRKLVQQAHLPIAASMDRLSLMFFPFNSAAVFCPCRSVVTIHDLHPYVVPERFALVHSAEKHGSNLRSRINKIYWKNILKVASKKADRIIAVSYATKKDIEKVFHISSNKIDVVHEGVDKERFKPDSSTPDLRQFRDKYRLPQRYILCVGTHGYKNLEGILESFNIIKKKGQDSVRLVIAGYRRYLTEKVIRLVRNLNLEREIVFTGFFPDDDLKYLYQCAEVFLFPSFYEGFGLPVLEAFACGVPVVTSTTGSLPEVAGDAALLVNPDDPSEIASCVLKLLTDKDFREKKSQEGLERVQKFSWQESARKTLEVFERVFSEN